jgi:hypothetical protein
MAFKRTFPVRVHSHQRAFSQQDIHNNGTVEYYDAHMPGGGELPFGPPQAEELPYGQTYCKTVTLESYDSFSDGGSSNRGGVAPCYHVKVRTNLRPHSGIGSYFGGGSPGYRFYSGLNINLTSDDVLSRIYSIKVDHPQPLRDFYIKAATEFKQQFPEIQGLANFLLELDDLKEMLPNLLEAKLFKPKPKGVKPAKPLNLDKAKVGNQRSRTEVRPDHKPPKKYSVGDGVKATGDNILRYDFGWKPFIGDLEALSSLMEKITKKLEFLRKENGKSRTLRSRRLNVYAFDDEFTFESRIPHPIGRMYQNYRIRRKYSADVFASTVLYQNVEGLNSANALWRAIFQGLGFTTPAKIWWNALPFSFVLDWVVPVGDWLGLFSINPFFGAWQFSNTVHTVRENEIWSVSWIGDGDQPEVFVGTVQVETYDRQLGLPISYEDLFVGLGDLSFSNITDAVALILGTAHGKKHAH